ncbi:MULTISPECIES: hypothetical protein [Ruminococcus]|uniref:DUF2634 domain-containing protein n=1 Tax=Ruminococcus bovis TaxID=2564099 RepID=A0A4V1G4Y6_9FIRM|nr:MULTISPECIES: hypothetical protein [Ruminococcus]MEE3439045.1 hypothetical protein [Ruminococcus sp.]QCT06353.1 hypothetical protein E5Z56_02870 [Ruminococcus bovis]
MYDLMIKDGGTVFLGSTEEKVYDVDSIFQRIELCLSLDKGSFIYNKNLGSTIPKLDYSTEEDLAQLEMYINQCVFSIVNTRVTVLSVDKEKQTVKISLKLGNKEYVKEVNVYGRL